MKFSLVAIAFVCLFAAALVGHRGLGLKFATRAVMPTSASPAQAAASTAVVILSPNADRRKHLERAIARGVQRERWWMLFVGITLVSYRLVRKHQALFENTFLYPSYELQSYEGVGSESTDDQEFESPRRARSAA